MKRQPLDIESILLRPGEAAELLGCSRALAYKWAAARVIPTVILPGSRTVRIPRAALLKWIEEHTQEPRRGAA